MSGTVFVLNDGRALALSGGSYSGGQHYAETLNQYKQILGDGVNVYSLVSPTAVSFYMPEEHAHLAGNEWDVIYDLDSAGTKVVQPLPARNSKS